MTVNLTVRRASAVLIAGAVILGLACDSPTAPPPAVASVVIDAAPGIDLVPGATRMLVAIAKDASGATISGRVTSWSSSDPSKASVAGGLVTGVAYGSATISASVDGIPANIEARVREGAFVGPSGATFSNQSGTVTLVVPPNALSTQVTLTLSNAIAPPSSVRLLAGTAFELAPLATSFTQPVSITIKYDDALVPAGFSEGELQLYRVAGPVWQLVDGSTANTDANSVTGTVTSGGVYAVMLRPSVATVTITGASSPIAVPVTQQLAATLRDGEATPLSRPVEWSSSNPSALSVSTTGLVTARVPGSAVITATSEGKSATVSYAITAGAPAKLIAFAGNNQHAPPGGAVPMPPSVIVTDAGDNPVSGVTVNFVATTGGGSVTGGSATTNAAGIAAVGSWTLGTTPGNNSLTATSPAIPGASATFQAIVPIAAAIAGFAGNNQTARIGTAVATPPSVIVTDATGIPVSGISVTFAVTSGGGSISGAVATTNAQGIATVGSWTLGTSLGANTLSATSGTISGSPVVFVATASIPATGMSIVAGNNQSAQVGFAVAIAPSVKVVGADGAGVGGIPVEFAVESGGGSISGGSATTNADGIATAGAWTLGPNIGSNTLIATSPLLTGLMLRFNATGGPPPPAKIEGSNGDGQTANINAVIPTPPSVKVSDSNGNPVAGFTVMFVPGLGEGTVTGGQAVTDASGIATVGSWKLGPVAGQQTLNAVADGLTGSPVVFNATAIARIPTSIAVFAGNNQTVRPANQVPTPPAVRLTDVEGAPVPGVAVAFVVSSGGGSITGASPVTDANGVATIGGWILGPVSGPNSLSASGAGLSVSINATAAIPGVAGISINAGNNQSSAAGQAVPVSPSVRVNNTEGNPASGVTVTFAVTSGGGSITGATAVSNASGIATVGGWTLGIGANSLSASAPGFDGSPLAFTAFGTAEVQIVTFGDSNTDIGFQGTNFTAVVASYISSASPSIKLSPAAPHSSLQLAGKIEARWKASSAKTIKAVNHGISGTSSGAGRTGVGAPNGLEQVGGVSRFRGEVLGDAYPWSGGEPANAFYPAGAIARVQAFIPRTSDFAYVSLGTNDIGSGVAPVTIAANLGAMIDAWVGRGLPANKFMITTIPPRYSGFGIDIPDLNTRIRTLAAAKGVRLIDLASFVSNDDGITWKSPAMHLTGDELHYSEAVRDWLADQVVSIMLPFS